MRAGAAVELLHMATLVHDDVLDRAPMRRGRPTVFWSSGREAATATGDFLFSRAFAQLAATGNADGGEGALGRVVVAGARRADAARRRVRTGRDRGALLRALHAEDRQAVRGRLPAGSVLGDPGEESADALGRFGDRIGLAFQLFDDVLDLSGPPDQTGKSRGTDLLDGTVTLPSSTRARHDPSLRGERPENTTQAEALCDRSRRRARSTSRASERSSSSPRRRTMLAMIQLAGHQRRRSTLVADGVVGRYS